MGPSYAMSRRGCYPEPRIIPGACYSVMVTKLFGTLRFIAAVGLVVAPVADALFAAAECV